MRNLKNMNVVELSKSEIKKVNGGFLGKVLFAVAMFSIFSIAEHPDAFAEGVNRSFESSL